MCGNYAGGVLLRPALCSCQFVQAHTEREHCIGGRDICELIASIRVASVTGSNGSLLVNISSSLPKPLLFVFNPPLSSSNES